MKNHLLLFDQLGKLSRRRYQTAERYFSAVGLNHSQARLISLLNEAGGGASQDTLSRLIVVDRSNAGRALKSLEQEGYIVRRSGDTDRRTNFVALTSKGHQAFVKIARLRIKIAEDLFGGLRKDEVNVLVDLLGKALDDT